MQKIFTLSLAAAALSTALSAHATFVNPVAKNDNYSRLAIKIPHGCGDASTTKLKIILPDGLYMAAPIFDANMKITLKKGAQPPAKIWGKERSEGVREITYEGFSLPSEMVGEFGFYAYVHTDASALRVTIEQSCGEQTISWSATDAGAKHPAAALRIRHAEASAHHH